MECYNVGGSVELLELFDVVLTLKSGDELFG